jgi:WD40 repeat protein
VTGEFDSATTQSTVRLWNTATGRADSLVISQSGFFVSAVALSPDGQRVALGVDDGLLLYDLRTGRSLGNLLRANDMIISVAFRADSLRVATVRPHVRYWPGSTSPDMLCAKLSSDLNPQQWAAIVSPLDAPYERTCNGLPISTVAGGN